jgi:hypothetical protein
MMMLLAAAAVPHCSGHVADVQGILCTEWVRYLTRLDGQGEPELQPAMKRVKHL